MPSPPSRLFPRGRLLASQGSTSNADDTHGGLRHEGHTSSFLGGGTSSGQHQTRVLKIRGPANLAGAWSAQPVPASPRPPRAAHRPAAARAPRTTPGCTCGHGSAPPTAPRPRAYAGGGPWRRKSPFGSPMTGRRPRMTRAHDRQRTLPQRRCTSCMNEDPQRLVLAPRPHPPPLAARPRLRRLAREAVQRLAAALVRARYQAYHWVPVLQRRQHRTD